MTESNSQQSFIQIGLQNLEGKIFDKDGMRAYACGLVVKIKKCELVERHHLDSHQKQLMFYNVLMGKVNLFSVAEVRNHYLGKILKSTFTKRIKGEANYGLLVSKEYRVMGLRGVEEDEQCAMEMDEELLDVSDDIAGEWLYAKIENIIKKITHSIGQNEKMIESYDTKANFWRGCMNFDITMMRDSHHRINEQQSETLTTLMDLCQGDVGWGLLNENRDERLKACVEGKVKSETQDEHNSRIKKGEEETMMDYSRRIREGFLAREGTIKAMESAINRW